MGTYLNLDTLETFFP